MGERGFELTSPLPPGGRGREEWSVAISRVGEGVSTTAFAFATFGGIEIIAPRCLPPPLSGLTDKQYLPALENVSCKAQGRNHESFNTFTRTEIDRLVRHGDHGSRPLPRSLQRRPCRSADREARSQEGRIADVRGQELRLRRAIREDRRTRLWRSRSQGQAQRRDRRHRQCAEERARQ